MTILSDVNTVTVNANGSATEFSFSPMKIFHPDEIKVTVVLADDTVVEPARGAGATQYVVNGNFPDEGLGRPVTGSITYEPSGTPLVLGDRVIFTYNLEYTQPLPIQNQGGYLPENMEGALDRNTILIAQVGEIANRSLVVPIGDSRTSEQLLEDIFDAADATAASVAATAADVIAAQAAADEAELNVAKMRGTSTTSVAIGTGTKVLTTQADKFFDDSFVLITSDADENNFMHGLAAYSGTTLTVDVTTIGGSGTLSDWTIKVSGAKGATGNTGAAGSLQIANAGGTADAITADFSPDLTLADNLVIQVVNTAGANTVTNPTLNTDGSGALTIKARGNAALVAGDTGAAGYTMTLRYEATGTYWELQNPAKAIETDIVLAYNTTNNASTTKHGFMPKLSNSATLYHDSLGTQTNPALNAVLTGYTSGAGTVAVPFAAIVTV